MPDDLDEDNKEGVWRGRPLKTTLPGFVLYITLVFSTSLRALSKKDSFLLGSDPETDFGLDFGGVLIIIFLARPSDLSGIGYFLFSFSEILACFSNLSDSN